MAASLLDPGGQAGGALAPSITEVFLDGDDRIVVPAACSVAMLTILLVIVMCGPLPRAEVA